jgi:hypothetical protein
MRTVIILVVVILVVIALGLWAMQRQRTNRLRRRFGDEYDRTLDRTGNRRETEQTLAQAAQRRDELTLRTLTAEQRRSWLEQWSAVQARFVDAPADAVTTARDLLPALMRDRGYPTDDFEERATLLAADHPVVVGEYRAAEQAYQRHVASGGSSTEALRQSLVHYRALFEALVDEHEDRPDGPGRDGGPGPEADRPDRTDDDGAERGSLHGRHVADGAPVDRTLDTDHRGGTR